jgi:hypothetical protein
MEEFEKGITLICLSLTRKKTGVSFITFLGSWSVKLLMSFIKLLITLSIWIRLMNGYG